MSSEDDFEFELEEDSKRKPKKGSSKVRQFQDRSKNKKMMETSSKYMKKDKKRTEGGTSEVEAQSGEMDEAPYKKAKKVPLAEGIKRRLAQNKREIVKLRREIREVKDDKEAFESELESLEEEFERLKSEKERLEEEINHKVAVATALEKKQNRTQKDFENFKKRTDSEIERKAKISQKKLFLGIIETLDNMDRALTELSRSSLGSESKAIISGFDSIRKSMLKTLADQNVEAIDPINMRFDPHFHDAVDTIMDRSVNENTVLTVEAKGYLLGDMVLRPAKVKVSIGGKQWPKEEATKEKEEEDKDEGGSVEDDAVKPSKRKKKEDVEELDEVEEDELDELIEEIDDLTGKKKG